MVIWSISEAMMNMRQKVLACSGGSISQICSMVSISKSRGMAKMASRKKQYLQACCERKSILSLSLLPSALTICGVIALSMACDMACMAPKICVAMP